MQSDRTVVFRFFLIFIFFACAAPGTVIQTEYEAIQKVYPESQNIIKVIFKEQIYFVLTDTGKIDKIIKVVETGNHNQKLWFVLDSTKRLDEVIRYPEMERYDLKDKQISLMDNSPFIIEKYSDGVNKLRADLADDWDALIEKINVKLYKVDATSQATP